RRRPPRRRRGHQGQRRPVHRRVAGLGDQPRTHVELADVSKRFGAVRALDGVSLIVAGVLVPDAGRLLLSGEEVTLRSPREALERGVATIAQEVNVVPQLTVEE